MPRIESLTAVQQLSGAQASLHTLFDDDIETHSTSQLTWINSTSREDNRILQPHSTLQPNQQDKLTHPEDIQSQLSSFILGLTPPAEPYTTSNFDDCYLPLEHSEQDGRSYWRSSFYSFPDREHIANWTLIWDLQEIQANGQQNTPGHRQNHEFMDPSEPWTLGAQTILGEARPCRFTQGPDILPNGSEHSRIGCSVPAIPKREPASEAKSRLSVLGGRLYQASFAGKCHGYPVGERIVSPHEPWYSRPSLFRDCLYVLASIAFLNWAVQEIFPLNC